MTSTSSHITQRAEADEPPIIIIKPSKGLGSLQLGALWEYRELLFFMVWRDVKVRYKQTALGVGWIVLQPVLATLVFSGVFGLLLGVPSNGVPYPVFALAGLVPWQYFATSLTRASTNLVDSSHLITKVYFPRLIIPLSGVVAGLIDFAVSAMVLVVLLVLYRIPPTPAVLFLPLFLLMAMGTALGFGLWFSALNVRYRDIKQLVPFVVQIWMYVTPVIYSATMIPESLRPLLALNPMTSVVEGFRWALLGNVMTDAQPPGGLFVVSLVIMVTVLMGGLFYFRSTEQTFADII